MIDAKGMSIVFAIFAVLVLSILGLVLFSFVSSDSGSVASQILSSRSLFSAESGWQIGAQAVKDDKSATDGSNLTTPSDNGYCRVSYLDGGFNGSYDSWPTSGGTSVRNPQNVIFHGRAWNNPLEQYAMIQEVSDSYISIWDFQQRLNLIGGKLLNLRIVLKARKNSGGGTNPQVRLQYSVDGGASWHPTPPGEPVAGFEFTIDNNSWPTPVTNYRFSPNLGSDLWQYLMANNGSDTRIRVLRLNEGNREVYVDWLALEVTTEVDSSLEPWGSNSYMSFPAVLGNSSIDSITVMDESGKININYAPQNVMRRLFAYDGIPNWVANAIATAIVSYRAGDWFNTIEEVKQVSGMTDAYFDLIKDDITVYSWVNQNVLLPSGSRPPVNINTASENVLKSIIRCSMNDSRSQDLASAIIAQRGTAPFANTFSSYETQDIGGGVGRDTECFAGFLEDSSLSWLTAARTRMILNVADGSAYNLTATSNWSSNDDAGGVEFCYYSHTFLIESKGKNGDIERTVFETYGDIYNYTTYTYDATGQLALPVYIGESGPKPYWREEQ